MKTKLPLNIEGSMTVDKCSGGVLLRFETNTVRVAGEIDWDSAKTLRDALTEALGEPLHSAETQAALVTVAQRALATCRGIDRLSAQGLMTALGAVPKALLEPEGT